MKSCDLSIVMAAHDASGVIARPLAALFAQGAVDLVEAIIAGSSTDHTPLIAQQFAGPRLLRRTLARNPDNPNMPATREVLKNALAAFQGHAPARLSASHARDVLEVVAGCYVAATAEERVQLGSVAQKRLREVRMGAPGAADHG